MSDTITPGEMYFAEQFKFPSTVPIKKQKKLRSYLYKFADNYFEAKEYLQLLKQTHELANINDSEFIFRVSYMSIQCFALAVRRMTDSGNRSIRELLRMLVVKEEVDAVISEIEAIYGHYSDFLNWMVAHEDIHSKQVALSAFPNTDIIDADMKRLLELYNTIVSQICTECIRIDSNPIDYSNEILKLAPPKSKYKNEV